MFKDLKNAKNYAEYEKVLKVIENKLSDNNISDDTRNVIKKHLDTIREEKINLEKMNKTAQARRQMIEDFPKIKKRMLVTTGYSFEGFRIKKYLNIVHGEVVLGTGFLSELSVSVSDVLGGQSNIMQGKLSQAKAFAQDQMLGNAYLKGANAIIGIDFDISTLGNNVIVVSTNGTAVLIEKEEA